MIRSVCVITGSRAEYGLLRGVMQRIKDDEELSLQVIATGMHLSPEFGLTYREILDDGFQISRKLEMLVSSDTSVGVAKSMGLGVIGFADALNELRPSLIVILGDRFEILAAAQTAMAMQIPVVHLGGGDIGSGTYDNIIRHCVTKLASLHFVTHDEALHRVVQMGERPDRVFCFGATCVENILNMQLLSRDELVKDLAIEFKELVFLVTFHPLTMDEFSAENQLDELLRALRRFLRNNNCTVIFTKSNADNGGRRLNQVLGGYVKQYPNCYLYDSLGQVRYISIMKQASVVIGNSSSGIYEAPYLHTPTVDVGSRQRGRSAPSSVIRCEPDESSIVDAINKALSIEFMNVKMIYGHGDVSRRIVSKIKEFIDDPGLSRKGFLDLKVTR